jgi:hypothetical protein
MALSSFSSYGLTERFGKGEIKVTERARSILHPNSPDEKKCAIRSAAMEPQLYRELRDRFPDLTIPPEDGVITYLNRQGFNPTAVRPAAKAFLQTMVFMEEAGATESHGIVDPIGDNASRAQDGTGAGDGTARATTTISMEANRRLVPTVETSDGGIRLMENERVVFVEECGPDQYLKLIASGTLDAGLLEALEDYVRRQKKRLTLPRPETMN